MPPTSPLLERPATKTLLFRSYFSRLSFRTQVLLVFILCMALVGIGIVFLNAYLIGGLKEQMRVQAILLAEDQCKQTSDEIQRRLASEDPKGLGELQKDETLNREIEIIFKGNNRVMAVCVVDTAGHPVLFNMSGSPDMLQFTHTGDGIDAEFNPADFKSIQMRLRQAHPKMRTLEMPILKNNVPLGSVRFLISESGILRDIEATGGQITRHLWSVLLAFVGVLALGLYLMAQLFRRQLHLIGENEQLDRMAYVGTLASGLAHEIRNPLNAMSVNLSVAEEEVGAVAGETRSAETIRRAIGFLQREVGRLDRSVTNFMAFAQPASNRQEWTDLRLLVDEVLNLLQPQIDDAGTTVETQLPGEARLRADFSGLRQVIYNVVLNALQAMSSEANKDRPRRLAIGGRRESAQWLLWIEDTGPGLPPGAEDRIFEVFYSTKAAGSGFGLSIARAIIESHDGDIRATRAESGGTRVEITLPETGRITREGLV